ncbi:hypothetical protein OG21DRAFT_1011122 [Imleria badia]|nr:hypothetical protein OG21DRAFT_1011122 [Imleria badia]
MATSSAALPPMGNISMIGIWIETVLYGVNCVMYGLCMFMLLRGGKVPTVRWVLLVMCTILFLLCTVHVGASVRQLLEAFVYAPLGAPDYSTTYWLDYVTTLHVLKDNVYSTLLLVQDFILIWRLYVVFMCDWRIVVFPVILLASSVASAYAISAISMLPNAGLYGTVGTLIISTWVSGLILNVSVTGAIAGRLWWMGRTIASLTATSTNRFASSIYIVIESGAINVVTGTAMFALTISNSPAASSAVDVASQLTALAPLLIVVQVAQADRCHHIPSDDFSNMVLTTKDEITFRVEVPGEQDSHQDLALDTAAPSRSPSFVHRDHKFLQDILHSVTSSLL